MAVDKYQKKSQSWFPLLTRPKMSWQLSFLAWEVPDRQSCGSKRAHGGWWGLFGTDVGSVALRGRAQESPGAPRTCLWVFGWLQASLAGWLFILWTAINTISAPVSLLDLIQWTLQGQFAFLQVLSCEWMDLEKRWTSLFLKTHQCGVFSLSSYLCVTFTWKVTFLVYFCSYC